jgi:DHA1 family bicyclomycin/chloramphenicol resistance-like MFS transporter
LVRTEVSPPPRLLLAALIASGTAAIPIYVPALPLVATDLGASTAEVQQTVTFYLIVFAIAQLLAGPISDNVGRRAVALTGLVAFVIGGAIGAAAPTVEILLAGRMIQAAGGAAGTVLARTIIRDVFDGEDVARALSRVVTVAALSPILAPVIGGFVADWFGWRATLWLLVVIGVVILAAVVMILPETSREGGARRGVAETLATYLNLLGNRPFLAHTLIGALFTATYYAFLTGMPLVLAHDLGLGASEMGSWFATVPLLYLIGNAASARFGARRGMAWMLGLGLWITGLSMAGLVLAAVVLPPAVAVYFLPVLVLSLGHGIGNPNANAMAMTAINARVGTAVALIGGIQMATSALASGAVSVFHSGGALPVVAVMAALQGALTMVYLLARRRTGG